MPRQLTAATLVGLGALEAPPLLAVELTVEGSDGGSNDERRRARAAGPYGDRRDGSAAQVKAAEGRVALKAKSGGGPGGGPGGGDPGGDPGNGEPMDASSDSDFKMKSIQNVQQNFYSDGRRFADARHQQQQINVDARQQQANIFQGVDPIVFNSEVQRVTLEFANELAARDNAARAFLAELERQKNAFEQGYRDEAMRYQQHLAQKA